MMTRDNTIQQTDAIEGLKQLKDNSVDLIITDPPYNIASDTAMTIQRGKLISTRKAWGQWDTFHPFDYKLLINQVLSQAYRVLRPGGALYMFTAQEDNGYFIHHALERGFVVRRVLAMVRKNPLPSMAKRNWRSGFELCMYLIKPEQERTSTGRALQGQKCGPRPTFNFLSQQECVNVFHYANGHRRTAHPTEKPQAFIERLVQVSSNAGDLVVDPFMGGGTTAAACKRLGRRFRGFDTNAKYVRMARDRVEKQEAEN